MKSSAKECIGQISARAFKWVYTTYLQKSASTPPRTSPVKFACSPCTDPPGVPWSDARGGGVGRWASGVRQVAGQNTRPHSGVIFFSIRSSYEIQKGQDAGSSRSFVTAFFAILSADGASEDEMNASTKQLLCCRCLYSLVDILPNTCALERRRAVAAWRRLRLRIHSSNEALFFTSISICWQTSVQVCQIWPNVAKYRPKVGQLVADCFPNSAKCRQFAYILMFWCVDIWILSIFLAVYVDCYI